MTTYAVWHSITLGPYIEKAFFIIDFYFPATSSSRRIFTLADHLGKP